MCETYCVQQKLCLSLLCLTGCMFFQHPIQALLNKRQDKQHPNCWAWIITSSRYEILVKVADCRAPIPHLRLELLQTALNFAVELVVILIVVQLSSQCFKEVLPLWTGSRPSNSLQHMSPVIPLVTQQMANSNIMIAHTNQVIWSLH